MRLTRQAALAIALVCGLLAAVLAWMWIGQQNKPVEKAPTTVQVPVPIQTIPPQVQLRPEMFKKVVMERTRVPATTVLTEQGFEGRVSRAELLQDQPVTAEQIAIRSNKLGLSYGLAPGQRAMSVALDLVGAVADFIQPGNRVDVLVSFSREGKIVVRTVVQDVLVLAAGTSTTPPAPAAPAAAGATKANEAPPKRPEIPFTLAVTPAQAQLILTADIGGDLRLLLRAMGDHGIMPLPSSNSWSLIGPLPTARPAGGAPAAPAAAPVPPTAPRVSPGLQGPQTWGTGPARPALPTPKRPSVEVIRGGQREVVTPN